MAQEQAERLDIQKQLEKMRENELFTPDGQSPTLGRDPRIFTRHNHREDFRKYE